MPEHEQRPILDAVKKAAAAARASEKSAQEDAKKRDQLIKDAVESGQVTVTELAKAAGVHRSRVYQIRDNS